MTLRSQSRRIQTEYIEDEYYPKATTIINLEQRLEGARKIERQLSIILARKFIQCWKGLKFNPLNLYELAKLGRKDQFKFRKVSYQNEDIVDRSEGRLNSPAKARSRSQAYQRLKTQLSYEAQQEYQKIAKGKVLKVVEREVENTRAKLLEQIVEKLRKAKQEEQAIQNDPAYNVIIRKVTNLERMLIEIKSQKSSELSSVKHKTTFLHSQKQKTQTGESEEDLAKQLMRQIAKMKHEIGQIKANNEAIIKAELERSHASSINSAGASKNIALAPTQYVSSKGVEPESIRVRTDHVGPVMQSKTYSEQTLTTSSNIPQADRFYFNQAGRYPEPPKLNLHTPSITHINLGSLNNQSEAHQGLHSPPLFLSLPQTHPSVHFSSSAQPNPLPSVQFSSSVQGSHYQATRISSLDHGPQTIKGSFWGTSLTTCSHCGRGCACPPRRPK